MVPYCLGHGLFKIWDMINIAPIWALGVLSVFTHANPQTNFIPNQTPKLREQAFYAILLPHLSPLKNYWLTWLLAGCSILKLEALTNQTRQNKCVWLSICADLSSQPTSACHTQLSHWGLELHHLELTHTTSTHKINLSYYVRFLNYWYVYSRSTCNNFNSPLIINEYSFS